VAEGAGFENRWVRKGPVGSNPTLSALKTPEICIFSGVWGVVVPFPVPNDDSPLRPAETLENAPLGGKPGGKISEDTIGGASVGRPSVPVALASCTTVKEKLGSFATAEA
jgi:hypothetical protein